MPLALPEDDAALSIEDASRYGALSLFIERARMARMDFAATSADIATIAAICRRLDGLPLAIELAAARIRSTTPDELLARLSQQLTILVDGPRDLPERQQTLRRTIAWSYELLDEEDRAWFRRLAVFSGGWTADAAAVVAGYADAPQRDALGIDRSAALVHHSLARRDDRAGGGMRFSMLETIRAFGLEQLVACREFEEVSERHASYFTDLVEEQGFDIIVTDQPPRLAIIDRDYDNIRAALHWLADRCDAPNLIRLCSSIRKYWAVRGHLSEGRRWLATALVISDTPSLMRTRALRAASSLACHQGDLEQADELAREYETLSRRFDDASGIAGALHLRGLVAQLSGDFESARTFYEESVRLKRQLQHPLLNFPLGNLAQVTFHLGDTVRAVELFDECIAISRQTNDVILELGDDARAHALFVEALEIHRDVGYIRMIISTIEGMAAVAARGNHPVRAARLYGAIEVMCERIGYPRSSPDQWHYARFVDLARAQLDGETFAAAWAAGRELSVPAAIEYALSPTSDD
jgi:predicted ATPase